MSIDLKNGWDAAGAFVTEAMQTVEIVSGIVQDAVTNALRRAGQAIKNAYSHVSDSIKTWIYNLRHPDPAHPNPVVVRLKEFAKRVDALAQSAVNALENAGNHVANAFAEMGRRFGKAWHDLITPSGGHKTVGGVDDDENDVPADIKEEEYSPEGEQDK